MKKSLFALLVLSLFVYGIGEAGPRVTTSNPSTSASSVSFDPIGDLAATTVEDALIELDTEKEPVQTPASQAEAEAGTEAALRSWSPVRVFQAIAAKITAQLGAAYDTSAELAALFAAKAPLDPTVIPSAGNITLTADQCHGSILEFTLTGESELPAGVSGMTLMVRSAGAFAHSLDPNGTETITLNGVALAAGNKVTSPAAINASCVLYYNGTSWIIWGPSEYTDGGA